MDTTVKTPKEEFIGTIDDLTIPEDVLYANNTFNLNALNEALERLSLINFWSLYQTQRARLQIKRFDIPFREFKPVYRLSGEKTKDYYPRRHMAYIDYQFIRAELRKDYRKSELYNTPVNQEQIAEHDELFRYNHMVFINGEYISTTEVYPQEAKTGIIIDVTSNRNTHGITYEDYTKYMETNPIVTVVIVPSFKVTMVTTNRYVLDGYNWNVPFDKITGSDHFNENTLCFVNTEDGVSRKICTNRVKVDPSIDVVRIDRGLTYGGKSIRLCFITFDSLYDVRTISNDSPYIQLDTKMPCPVEHFFMMTEDTTNGRMSYNKDIKVEMFYPNIYKFSGFKENEKVRLYVMQDEEVVTPSEEYINELAKYEEYVAMLPRYEDGSIPEVIKNYRPSTYVYSIDDFEGSIYVPSTMNYKVQKLHKTIYENPWALAVYLDLLNLPIDKFYLDMEKIDLSNRVREDSSREDIDPGQNVVYFDEDMYVFAMNRHYVDTRSYGFRIFIDGLFQLDNTYVILPGPDFYFIYLPVDKVKSDSVIEIERYKLFTIDKKGSTDSLDNPVMEFDFSEDRQMVGYSREIYAIDLETMRYIPKKYLRIDVLYKFAEGGNKWVTIPDGRNIPLENKVRVYITDSHWVGKQVRVGLQRKMSMVTGDAVTEEDKRKEGTFWYTRGEISNFGGFDKSNYRVFNNGRILLPIQYYVNVSPKYGGKTFFRTSSELHVGDQFTIDHVPAQFRVVYYQHEVDVENKKGYVDVDGKLALPISLKWYDIYLNGRKLHKKNIEIISPTKFYIQGVESRKHLMIVVKNRDTEIFHLPYYEDKMDTPVKIDWNNTIIDELMEDANGLKEVIDATKKVIDPNDEFFDIATNVAMNVNALIFFFEFFMYTFINANKKQITQDIKDTFPMLILENGVLPIDSNDGAVKNDSIGGYLIKAIDCNVKRGEEDMFTDPNVNYDGIGALQDRFAIRPLNTSNFEYGLREEFLTDPNTAEPALVNADGTVTALNTMVRMNNHINNFSSEIALFGMGHADIYKIAFDNEYETKTYQDGENLITENISTEIPVDKICISIDATFLGQIGDCKMLSTMDVDPTVTIGYIVDGAAKGYTCKLSRLKEYAIEENQKVVTINTISLSGIPETVNRTFIHSILLAF